MTNYIHGSKSSFDQSVGINWSFECKVSLAFDIIIKILFMTANLSS